MREIPLNAQGRRRIDLAVISHIDHDQIGRAARLFADISLKLEFGDIWFNAPSPPLTRGVREGVGLAAVLGAAARGVPWNLAFAGRDGVTGPELFNEVTRKRGEPQITLLSPTRQTLDNLYRVWAKELPKERVSPEPEPLATPRSGLNVEALIRRLTPEDRAPANGSSIAFLLEHNGATALLTAHAFPCVLQRALAAGRQPTPSTALDARPHQAQPPRQPSQHHDPAARDGAGPSHPGQHERQRGVSIDRQEGRRKPALKPASITCCALEHQIWLWLCRESTRSMARATSFTSTGLNT